MVLISSKRGKKRRTGNLDPRTRIGNSDLKTIKIMKKVREKRIETEGEEPTRTNIHCFSIIHTDIGKRWPCLNCMHMLDIIPVSYIFCDYLSSFMSAFTNEM
jgi:hypothetical protein